MSLTREQRVNFEWLGADDLQRVVSALDAAEPGVTRFVGGCVRDSLLGTAPQDFDLATALEPDAVMAALKNAGLGAAPTGLDHGTVTAVVDHRGVEVTSLRADLSTDGRRATVAFTRDWTIDANRRDFRINAIYLTPDGKVFDPVGGIEDIEKKRVRFIGDPDRRIEEDYLRILRFFRFSARFSERFDEEGIAACARLRGGIGGLSAERIGAEFMKILSLPRADFALRAMQQNNILSEISPASANIDAVKRLKEIEASPMPPLVLAALYRADSAEVGRRLRLSNAEKAIAARALKAMDCVTGARDERRIKETIYRLGKDTVADAAALAVAFEVLDKSFYERVGKIVDGWSPPAFPFSGKDVVAAGVKPGPEVAAILKKVENQWVEQGYPEGAAAKKILAEALAGRRRTGSGADPI